MSSNDNAVATPKPAEEPESPKEKKKLLDADILVAYYPRLGGDTKLPVRSQPAANLRQLLERTKDQHTEFFIKIRAKGRKDSQVINKVMEFVKLDLFSSTVAMYKYFKDFERIVFRMKGRLGLKEGGGAWSARRELPYNIQRRVLGVLQSKNEKLAFKWSKENTPRRLEEYDLEDEEETEMSDEITKALFPAKALEIIEKRNKGLQHKKLWVLLGSSVRGRNDGQHRTKLLISTLSTYIMSDVQLHRLLDGPEINSLISVNAAVLSWQKDFSGPYLKRSLRHLASIYKILHEIYSDDPEKLEKEKGNWVRQECAQRRQDLKAEGVLFMPHVEKLSAGLVSEYSFSKIEEISLMPINKLLQKRNELRNNKGEDSQEGEKGVEDEASEKEGKKEEEKQVSDEVIEEGMLPELFKNYAVEEAIDPTNSDATEGTEDMNEKEVNEKKEEWNEEEEEQVHGEGIKKEEGGEDEEDKEVDKKEEAGVDSGTNAERAARDVSIDENYDDEPLLDLTPPAEDTSLVAQTNRKCSHGGDGEESEAKRLRAGMNEKEVDLEPDAELAAHDPFFDDIYNDDIDDGGLLLDQSSQIQQTTLNHSSEELCTVPAPPPPSRLASITSANPPIQPYLNIGTLRLMCRCIEISERDWWWDSAAGQWHRRYDAATGE